MRMRVLHLVLALSFLAALARPAPVMADDGGGGNEPPNSVWGEVFNPDGSLRDDLIDKGVITQDADWMPNILFLGSLKAEYHVYVTQSGTTVVMPSATTLFFMALRPHESGFDRAASVVANGLGWHLITSSALVARPKEVFAQIAQGLGVWDAVKDHYVSPDQFADAVIAGRNGVWSFGLGDVWKMFWTLAENSISDQAIYTAFLVYPPDMCYLAPGGCAVEPTPQPTPPPSVCAAPEIRRGEISASARLLAPPYPMVVGQDPNKRGVDLEFRLIIEPTIYTWYEEVTHRECVYVADGTGSGCPDHPDNPYYREDVWTECVAHQVIFRETPNWVKATATLSEKSRQWILRQLAIRYPGAYLHHPDWDWTNPWQAQSEFQGDTFVWTFRVTGVQVADPGWYDMILDGHTSGTPVTAGRPFHIAAGRFPVYLITTTLTR